MCSLHAQPAAHCTVYRPTAGHLPPSFLKSFIHKYSAFCVAATFTASSVVRCGTLTACCQVASHTVNAVVGTAGLTALLKALHTQKRYFL